MVPSKPVNSSPTDPEAFCPLISLPATDSHPSLKIRSTIPRGLLISLSREEYKDYIESLVPGLQIQEISTETRLAYISSEPSFIEKLNATAQGSKISDTNPPEAQPDVSDGSSLKRGYSLGKLKLTKAQDALKKFAHMSIPKFRIPQIVVEHVSVDIPPKPNSFPYTRYVPTQIPAPTIVPLGFKRRSDRPSRERQLLRSLPRLSIPHFHHMDPVEEVPIGEALKRLPVIDYSICWSESIWDGPSSSLFDYYKDGKNPPSRSETYSSRSTSSAINSVIDSYLTAPQSARSPSPPPLPPNED